MGSDFYHQKSQCLRLRACEVQKLGNKQKKSAVEMGNSGHCGPHEAAEDDGGGEVGTQELRWRWAAV